jgi:WD40 repeat protein
VDLKACYPICSWFFRTHLALFIALIAIASLSSVTPARAEELPETDFCRNNPRVCVVEGLVAPGIEPVSKLTQWGKGSILAVAFAPDGQRFAVGSVSGFAVYDMHALNEAPRWLVFEEPFWYDRMTFSADGAFLHLANGQEHRTYAFADGKLVDAAREAREVSGVTSSWVWDVDETSPDGALRFRGLHTYTYDEDQGEREISVREMIEPSRGEVLYRLTDPTASLTVYDYREREGCDLSFFSYCGNAYTPLVYSPYRARFAPSSETFAVNYRILSLGGSTDFSTLRVYNSADGKLLGMLGSHQQPVVDLAYSPDSRHLLVGFADGSIQLWDIASQKPAFSAWHFNAPIRDLAYTRDGKLVLVQRPNWVEVRRSSDGALRARYTASLFALSPTESLAALAAEDGTITLINTHNGEIVRQIEAHTDRILALAFSPDGQLLASSSQDCTIRLWDVSTGDFLHFFEQTIVDAYGEGFTRSRIFIHSLQFVPSANALIGFGSWATVVNWNVNSGATRYVIRSAPLEYYNGMMTLDPHFTHTFGLYIDANLLIVGENRYNLRTGEALGRSAHFEVQETGCSTSGLPSADGQWLFSRGTVNDRQVICVVEMTTRRIIQTLDLMPAGDEAYDWAGWLTLSPDGKRLILPTRSGLIQVYQVRP